MGSFGRVYHPTLPTLITWDSWCAGLLWVLQLNHCSLVLRMQEVRYVPMIGRCGAYLFTCCAAELNLPYYPLLRRNVDCVIALDASADSQVNSSTHQNAAFFFLR